LALLNLNVIKNMSFAAPANRHANAEKPSIICWLVQTLKPRARRLGLLEFARPLRWRWARADKGLARQAPTQELGGSDQQSRFGAISPIFQKYLNY
jgi:hypothetical protein